MEDLDFNLNLIFEEDTNNNLIPKIKFYKDNPKEINIYIISFLNALKKGEKVENNIVNLKKLNELLSKNFDIFLILISNCCVNSENQNLFDILIELYLDDNYQLLISDIFKNIKNNINISKEIIKSLFQCISKNYQSLNNSCDSKQFQKYIDLINFFYDNIEN